jgi:hypothetical protein
MYQKLLSLVLTLAIFQTAFAQAPTAKKPDEAEAEFKKETLVFLREAAADANNLRSAENRISFASELAGLMWFHDEREARGIFQGVASDFKQLVMNYDSQLSQLELGVDVDGDGRSGGGLLFGGDDSDKGKLERKLRVAMMVRQQITTSIAEHDPQLAFDFYFDSLNAIASVARRKQYDSQDKYFEGKLLNEIAERDAAKASEMGRKSLANGVNYQHIELLKKIYAKDVDKGVEFADAITSKLKDKSGDSDGLHILGSVLNLGIDNFDEVKKGGKKKPMFSEQALRDLSELLAQSILNSDKESGGYSMGYVDAIERFAPGRAAQIRLRNGMPPSSGRGAGRGSANTNSYYAIAAPPPPAPAGSYRGNTNSAVPRTPTEAERLREEKQRAEADLMNNVAGLSAKKLPKEERDKVVAQARKIVSEMAGKDKKIMALSMLAAQVAKSVDKELASEIMKDAHALISLQPRNYKDFIFVWMLASGYAEADPEKAFPLLEDSILRLNDTITGVVRVAEFIDVAGEIVDDGEVQVGAFGGSMIRGLTRELGIVDGTLRSLAKADLAKTKNLTNSFDRAEVRVLAKMLVLRAIMGNKKQPGDGDEHKDVGTGVLDSN